MTPTLLDPLFSFFRWTQAARYCNTAVFALAMGGFSFVDGNDFDCGAFKIWLPSFGGLSNTAVSVLAVDGKYKI